MSGRAVLLAWAMVLGLVLLGPGVAEAGRTQYTGVVNLNEASVEELDRLPGVGRTAAERILTHRQKRPFQRIEELVRVKGFRKKTFEKLKPYLTLTGPTTLHVVKISTPGTRKKSKR